MIKPDQIATLILSSTILSSLITLTFNYFQKKHESKDTAKRMARLFLHDIKRSSEMILGAKDAKKPLFSELSILDNWKADIHSLLPKLNKSETDQILSYYSKIDDLKKRQADCIEYVETKGSHRIADDFFSEKVNAFVYHSELLTEIEIKEVIEKLEKLS